MGAYRTRRHERPDYPYVIDTVTPFLATGGTVFGPHNGAFRPSLILAFAFSPGEEDRAANQRLAKALADRLNNEPAITCAHPSLSLIESIARRHIDELTAGGQFRFNPRVFSAATLNAIN